MPTLPGIDYEVPPPITPDVTLNNDQNTLLTIVTLDISMTKSYMLDYSIIRGSTTEVGRILITTDGVTLSFEIDKANNVDTGISLLGNLSGSNVIIRYLSTNTGQTGMFRYFPRAL